MVDAFAERPNRKGWNLFRYKERIHQFYGTQLNTYFTDAMCEASGVRCCYALIGTNSFLQVAELRTASKNLFLIHKTWNIQRHTFA